MKFFVYSIAISKVIICTMNIHTYNPIQQTKSSLVFMSTLYFYPLCLVGVGCLYSICWIAFLIHYLQNFN